MRRFFLRLLNVLRPGRMEPNLSREIASHVALLEEEYRRRGMSPEEAHRAARVALGGVEQTKEFHRRERSFGWLDDLQRDVRYAVRTLRRSPGFTVVAVITLALGIGANTAMFAVVNAVLLKSLPFHDADRLMLVHLLAPDNSAGPGVLREATWSYPKYRAFLEVQQTFDSTALFAERVFAIAGDGDPEQMRGEVVTDRYPAILGITPVLGRPFTGEETHRPGAQPVVLLGQSAWLRRFGGDTSIIGRTVHINNIPHTVVGVLPAGFRGLNGNAEVWVPIAVAEPGTMFGRQNSQNHAYTVVARRKNSITEQSALNAVRVYGGHVNAAFPDERADVRWGARAASLYDSRADADVRRASTMLLGAVGFVLLIACVNLTNLFVARGMARTREVAVRTAIGASRLRIARQFVIEALVLTAASGVTGLVIAGLLLQAGTRLLPDSDVFFRSPIAPGVARVTGAAGLTRIGASMIDLDWITVLFTGGIVVVAGLLIAIAPVLQASMLRPVDAIKGSGGAGTARGFSGLGTRAVLVTAQVSLALVLLAGAGLMLKSAFRLQSTSIGVDPANVLTARLDLPRRGYNADTGAVFYERLIERLRGLPEVESVGLGNCAPVSGGCNATSLWFPRQGPRKGSGVDPLVGIYWTTPEYFSTMRIRLLRGRMFTEQDRAGRPKVALVNEEAARTFWPKDTPIGKVIALGQGAFGDGAEVIGIVANVRYRTIEAAPVPDVYVPVDQSYQSRVRVFIRSQRDASSLATAVRQEIRALDPTLPMAEVKMMDERIGDAMWRTRIAVWLFSGFAALALLLTAVGIFGVMSQTVSQRTPEIGVRMALGAQARDVLKLVLGRAAVLAVSGVAVGLVLALGLTRLMTTLLYGVEATDAWTFGSVATLLAIVSLTAGYLPARRAARVDPLVALRYE